MSKVCKFKHSTGEMDYLEIHNGDDLPTIVMLHGYGANMRDLAPLASVHSEFQKYNWLFPDGPIKVSIGPMMFGRAWFPLDMEALNHAMVTNSFETLFSENLPNGLKEASSLLNYFIEEKVKGALVLGGFSQGSMMACELALNTPLSPKAILLLSSTLVAKNRLVEMLKLKGSIPTFQCHGTHDPVLPIKMARALKDNFEDQNWKVNYLEFPGGHEIPPMALQELGKFLGEF
jgi:phospholipase/carboxylesterase